MKNDETIRARRRSLTARYQIIGKLRNGGMSEVFLGHDSRLQRPVVIKRISERLCRDQAALLRFTREAAAASLCRHPNICTLYDSGCDQTGRPFLVMEFLPGETLHERLRLGPLEWEELLDTTGQILNALKAVHDLGFVHRDIKPRNILVTKNGRVKLIDFGLAKTSGCRRISEITGKGALIGTIAYMAPEQLLEKEVDRRSDLFALGMVLYQMACGRHPFLRSTPVETMYAIVYREPRTPPDLAQIRYRHFLRIVFKLLEKEPGMRYADAAEVVEAFRRLDSPVSDAPLRACL